MQSIAQSVRTITTEIVGTLHYASAAVFFVTMALMALFLFTRSGSATPTDRKPLRNLVYRVSGVAILVAIAAIAGGQAAARVTLERRDELRVLDGVRSGDGVRRCVVDEGGGDSAGSESCGTRSGGSGGELSSARERGWTGARR